VAPRADLPRLKVRTRGPAAETIGEQIMSRNDSNGRHLRQGPRVMAGPGTGPSES